MGVETLLNLNLPVEETKERKLDLRIENFLLVKELKKDLEQFRKLLPERNRIKSIKGIKGIELADIKKIDKRKEEIDFLISKVDTNQKKLKEAGILPGKLMVFLRQ